ncbi:MULTISPECIES: hypothetical protein [unclassified Nocardioides]|uniref:hypothetical protein n=1 Tax=unclassified Nocardioides TaxID=2615069 RepID=UPI0006F76D86|nr:MULTISPECIES: hypothetical protein [unclassified Nocardioides]KQY63773.1 hypothetical protein ASD30_01910 [Nocardioides sp. Root140]KRF15788.1 hypothetical protein ASH02_03905 [Nocardioides sp. Soil796]
MVDNPIELLTKSQRAALKMTSATFNALLDAGRSGAAAPELVLTQVTDLLGAVGDLAGATAQPLQDFVTRQRELADTMAGLAKLHADMAELVAAVAQRHADVVEAMERLSAPVLGLAGATSTATATPKAD